MMTPEEVLKAAAKEEVAPKTSKSRTWPYLAACHLLRQKNWPWGKVADWMAERTGVVVHKSVWADHYFMWADNEGVEAIRTRSRNDGKAKVLPR